MLTGYRRVNSQNETSNSADRGGVVPRPLVWKDQADVEGHTIDDKFIMTFVEVSQKSCDAPVVHCGGNS